MKALIAHTAPDENKPSKNHEIYGLVPKNWWVGENKTAPKKNPTHVEQHIIQDKIPEMKLKVSEKINSDSPYALIKFLIPLNMVP